MNYCSLKNLPKHLSIFLLRIFLSLFFKQKPKAAKDEEENKPHLGRAAGRCAYQGMHRFNELIWVTAYRAGLPDPQSQLCKFQLMSAHACQNGKTAQEYKTGKITFLRKRQGRDSHTYIRLYSQEHFWKDIPHGDRVRGGRIAFHCLSFVQVEFFLQNRYIIYIL